MGFRKIVNKPINIRRPGLNVSGGINAVVAGNEGERGNSLHVSSKSRNRIIQRGGKTIVETDSEGSEYTETKEADR
jgi:hypothetical protein